MRRRTAHRSGELGEGGRWRKLQQSTAVAAARSGDSSNDEDSNNSAVVGAVSDPESGATADGCSTRVGALTPWTIGNYYGP